MLPKMVVWSFFLLPWLTLLLLKKEIVKRFTPVAIFSCLVVTLYNELAYTQHWWEKKVSVTHAIIAFVPYVFGVFLIGTIWIFALTYRRFLLYMVVNIVIDFLFAFPMHNWFIKIGVVRNLKQGSLEIFIAFVFMALLLYIYQLWMEGALINQNTWSQKGEPIRSRFKHIIRN